MFSLKVAKVIGTPNGTAWSQVHDFKVEGEKLEKRGKLLVVLTLKEIEGGVAALSVGREVLARINEEYYGNLQGVPFERLKETLEKLAQEFQSLELLLAVFYRNVGYFGILGGGKVVVKRESVIQTILELGPDEEQGNAKTRNLASLSAETRKILIASGFVQEGDIFLLGSQKFFEAVAEGTWRAALGAGEPEEMVETLAPIVVGREKVGGVAAGIIKVGSGKWEMGNEIIKEDLDERNSLVSVLSEVTHDEKETPNVLLQKAKRVLRRLVSVFSVIQRVLGRFIRFRPKSVFVRRQADQQKRTKTLLTVAIILIFLLLVSIVLGIRKRVGEKRRSQVETLIAEIESKLEEGKGLGTIKPGEAKKVLQEAQKLLDEIEKSKVKSQKSKVLREEIETELAKVVKEYQFSELPVFLDLSLVEEDAKGDNLALFGNNLVVLDKKGKRLIGIDLEKKSSQILAGGEDLTGASKVAVWDDKVYVLTPKGILEFSYHLSPITYHLLTDSSWGEIADLSNYKGNFYLLDKGKNTVWRYLVTETGFGAKQNWLKGETKLSQPVSFAIDGLVWILEDYPSGPIRKFSSGVEEQFLVSGLEKSLASPTRIYTDDKTKNLYILDKGNYRVVVLDKEGNYQASYLWVGIADVQDLVVSEEAKKILLLAGRKIYEIEIK